jgi:SAM-dependent methyltransferase
MPELTPEQEAIRDEWMQHFYEIFSDRFSAIAWFSHIYPMRTGRPGLRTLDIGAGMGEHLDFEDAKDQHYVALELRPEMARVIEERHPYVTTVVGDAEDPLPFEDASFDRVIAIHVLEHLRNLPATLDEVRRVLRPGGAFAIVIPCEGGFAYGIGRRFTSQRIFEKRYSTSYDWYIRTEHFNVPAEIIEELDQRFEREHSSFFPLKVPTVHLNVCVGLTYRRPA